MFLRGCKKCLTQMPEVGRFALDAFATWRLCVTVIQDFSSQSPRTLKKLPARRQRSIPHHSLAARPAPAAAVPPGSLRQTLSRRPGCLPVVSCWYPLAWTGGRLAPGVPAWISRARTEGEILFRREITTFQRTSHCPFLTTEEKQNRGLGPRISRMSADFPHGKIAGIRTQSGLPSVRCP